MTHPNEIANRYAKALRFSGAIRAHATSKNLADQAARLTELEWARISELFGEKPPSIETVALIVLQLRHEEERDAAQADPDPFQGFPDE